MKVTISDTIRYIGVDDKTIDLFESQYIVPNGISYNSYLIMDEKIAVMDTVDGMGSKPDGSARGKDAGLSGYFPFGTGSCRKHYKAFGALSGNYAGRKRKNICIFPAVF